MSCSGCVFRGTFQDMGASCDVCNLQTDLVDAVSACKNSADCRHRFTVEEAKKIVIEREGGLPVILKEKTKSSEKSMQDAIKELGEAIGDALLPAIQAMTEMLNTYKEGE